MLRTTRLRTFNTFAQVNWSTRCYSSTSALSQYDGSFSSFQGCLLILTLVMSQSVSLAGDMQVVKRQRVPHEREQKLCC